MPWDRKIIWLVLSRENITVSNAVKTLTAGNLVTKFVYAQVQIQDQSVRLTVDGTDPNPATPLGQEWAAGAVLNVWGHESASNLKMIREGASDAHVEVVYYGEGS